MGLSEDIKQEKFTTEFQKVLVNVLFTGNWFNQQQYYMFKPYGITTAQYNVLRILRGQFPNSATVNLIIERMVDRMSNASRIVDKLVVKGYVSREKNEKDRRAVDVKITSTGLKLLEDLDQEQQRLMDTFGQYSKEECENVNNFLDNLRSSLGS